jgi:catechol 2,3-dioxygenase-like lactoylglutathione lyase family enzyme
MTTFVNAAPTVAVSDLAKARAFYEGTLGLTFMSEEPAGMRFQAGRGEVFVYPSQFAGTSQATVFGLEVEDVRAAVADLRGRGITFEQYDMPGLKTDEDGLAELGGELGAWFKDPDGNIVSVAQRSA